MQEELHTQEQQRIAALLKLAEQVSRTSDSSSILLPTFYTFQVPYFENIQDIESRLDHVTASVKAHQYIETAEGTRGHLPLNGFTDQKVIRDTRFRLAEAFRLAGIANSTAAKEMVQRFHPRPHLAIHGIL